MVVAAVVESSWGINLNPLGLNFPIFICPKIIFPSISCLYADAITYLTAQLSCPSIYVLLVDFVFRAVLGSQQNRVENPESFPVLPSLAVSVPTGTLMNLH